MLDADAIYVTIVGRKSAETNTAKLLDSLYFCLKLIYNEKLYIYGEYQRSY